MYKSYENKNKPVETIEPKKEDKNKEEKKSIETNTKEETKEVNKSNIEVNPLNTIENINNQIIIYLFHGETCPACKKTIEYMNKNMINLENVELRVYEVWNNNDNHELMKK